MAKNVTIEDLTEAASALIDAELAVEVAEKVLKQKKERARILREETIPYALMELGIQKLTLTTGQKLGIKQEVYASIPDTNKAEAFDWLNKHGFGGLIKTSVTTLFAKGEVEKALAFCKELEANGMDAAFDESIHAQTLKAFLREQISKGKDIPLDMFGARPVWTTTLSKK